MIILHHAVCVSVCVCGGGGGGGRGHEIFACFGSAGLTELGTAMDVCLHKINLVE